MNKKCSVCQLVIGDLMIEHDGRSLCMDCFMGSSEPVEEQEEQHNMDDDHNNFDMESLTCSICISPYNSKSHNPKILPCGHTFCSSCIKGFSGKCPTCRKTFSRSQIQKNFLAINIINELNQYFSQPQENNIPTGRRAREICKVHNSEIDQFCKTCEKLMCSHCTCEHLGKDYTKHIISDIAFRHEVEGILETYRNFEAKKKALFNKVDKFIQDRIQEVEEHANNLIQKIKNDLNSTTTGIKEAAERFKQQAGIKRNIIDCRKSSFDDYVNIYKKAQEDKDMQAFFRADFDFGLALTQRSGSSPSEEPLPMKEHNVFQSFFPPKEFCELKGKSYMHSMPSCACFAASPNYCNQTDDRKFRFDLVMNAQTYKAH